MYIPGFSGDIEKSPELLKEHSRDASVFEVTPCAVVYPKDSADIARVVAYAKEQKIPLAVRAGGTCMTGGSLTSGIVLNMTRYMKRVVVDSDAKTADVEMGAMFRDIEAQAFAQKLMFAPYPSSHLICGIGGMIGNNASGEKSIRFGATIDNIIELDVALADGTLLRTRPVSLESVRKGDPMFTSHELELYRSVLLSYQKYGTQLARTNSRVRKVASGYRLDRVVNEQEGTMNLAPLFIGAQGTLGLVTRAKLSLVPIPQTTRLLLISVQSFSELPFILKTVLVHNPEGVETFDVHTFDRARVSMPQEARLIETQFKDAASLVVLAQFAEGTQEATDTQARACVESLQKHPVAVTYVEDIGVASAAWKVRRASYALLRAEAGSSVQAVPCIEDIIVPIDQFGVLVPRLEQILSRYNLAYGFHGHIGDGALRVIPIIDLAHPKASETIVHLCRDVFALVRELGGSISGDHSDGIVRSPFLPELYGHAIYEGFREVKKIFDPENILNPEKKTGGNESNITRYLRRDWSN